ncbi:MAG: ribonuclease H-like domain-containing protein [Moorellales bacterium]
MLRHSFVFIPGIGRKTELQLWQRGILTWDDLRSGIHRAGSGRHLRDAAWVYLDRAQEALASRQVGFFARHLPRQEHWRVYGEFRDRTVFLDIETTGLSPYYHRITVVGCYDHRTPRAFIRGRNLEELAGYLRGFDLLVTFNGILFDLAFLRREFPEITLPPVHLDLRYLLKSLGLGGSQKSIETRLGLSRPEDLRELDGRRAAALGWRFLRGDQTALTRLLLYNRYDTVNLAPLMDRAYELKSRQAGFPFPDRLSAPALVAYGGHPAPSPEERMTAREATMLSAGGPDAKMVRRTGGETGLGQEE